MHRCPGALGAHEEANHGAHCGSASRPQDDGAHCVAVAVAARPRCRASARQRSNDGADPHGLPSTRGVCEDRRRTPRSARLLQPNACWRNVRPGAVVERSAIGAQGLGTEADRHREGDGQEELPAGQKHVGQSLKGCRTITLFVTVFCVPSERSVIVTVSGRMCGCVPHMMSICWWIVGVVSPVLHW